MLWSDIEKQSPLYLNLGGKNHCHPHPQYRQYISVDLNESDGWSIVHDITKPFPLPDACVDRVHTEDALHYLPSDQWIGVLNEMHRILKPGGLFRIAIPDYNNPKDRHVLRLGKDERYPLHLTLTTKDVVEQLLQGSDFTNYTFQHFWDEDVFVQHSIDYTVGMVQRTPDNDPRCKSCKGWKRRWQYLRFCLQKKFALSPIEKQCLCGQPLHVTSLVVDCYKRDARDAKDSKDARE